MSNLEEVRAQLHKRYKAPVHERQKLRANMTEEQKALWDAVRNKNLGVKFRRFANVPKTGLTVFLWCPSIKLAVDIREITNLDITKAKMLLSSS